MRLINADALLEKLRKTDRYFMVKFDIENEPTVEERQTGDWICTDEFGGYAYEFICSNCKNPEWKITRFCPNCGAEMKEVRYEIN